jgi:hypothetical protein
MKRWASLAFFCFVVCLAAAQDFTAATETVLPDGVRLGMGVADIKKARPATFEGPPASLPGSQDSKTYGTLMEVQNMGAPGHLSYWYLCAHERVVGVLRTRSLVGIDPESAKSAGQQTYSQLAQQLGAARQETLLRKGGTAFVPVRADVWRSKEGRAIYFIATDQEMTVAVVEATDFPLAQVFIRPDPQRFPIEEPDKRSVFDLERPAATASATPVPTATPTSVPSQTPEAQPLRETFKATPTSSPVAKPTSAPASQNATSWNVSRTLALVVVGAVVIAIAALLIRRRRP